MGVSKNGNAWLAFFVLGEEGEVDGADVEGETGLLLMEREKTLLVWVKRKKRGQ